MEPTTLKNTILAALATIGSFIANQLGGWDAALAVLIGMMAVDIFTGLLCAALFKKSPKTENGKAESNEMFKGLVRKLVILLWIWVAVMLDKVLGVEYIRTAVALFFIANEGLSIIENTALMGVPYPAFVKTALEALKDKNDKAIDTDAGS
jgi:toxin secretion/phage lysis holin